MQTFEADINHFNPNQPYVGDEKTPVRFFMDAVQDHVASTDAGRPIYKDAEFIQIFNSKDNIICREVRDTDKQRWPRQYGAWKATGENVAGGAGTRLEMWPAITKAQAEELKYFKIFTVEQLADFPDSQAHNFPGFQKLKALARGYIELAAGQAPITRLQEQLDQEKSARAALEDQLAKMNKRLEKLTAKAE
jgi:hypothetical protein